MGIDDESSHSEVCSEVADGVTRNIVYLFREPDAGNLPVRFDEREQETEPSQTGLRWRGESHVEYPPGDYSHCAVLDSTFLLRSKRLKERNGVYNRVDFAQTAWSVQNSFNRTSFQLNGLEIRSHNLNL